MTTPPPLPDGPWPTCCGHPMWYGPHGMACSRCAPEPDGLFPEPTRQRRCVVAPELAPAIVTARVVGGVL